MHEFETVIGKCMCDRTFRDKLFRNLEDTLDEYGLSVSSEDMRRLKNLEKPAVDAALERLQERTSKAAWSELHIHL